MTKKSTNRFKTSLITESKVFCSMFYDIVCEVFVNRTPELNYDRGDVQQLLFLLKAQQVYLPVPVFGGIHSFQLGILGYFENKTGKFTSCDRGKGT